MTKKTNDYSQALELIDAARRSGLIDATKARRLIGKAAELGTEGVRSVLEETAANRKAALSASN